MVIRPPAPQVEESEVEKYGPAALMMPGVIGGNGGCGGRGGTGGGVGGNGGTAGGEGGENLQMHLSDVEHDPV